MALARRLPVMWLRPEEGEEMVEVDRSAEGGTSTYVCPVYRTPLREAQPAAALALPNVLVALAMPTCDAPSVCARRGVAIIASPYGG